MTLTANYNYSRLQMFSFLRTTSVCVYKKSMKTLTFSFTLSLLSFFIVVYWSTIRVSSLVF